ncbi:DUF292-domain-containing protein [Teratosphaeria nubilosa]|uniref:DUF292-domain-containing protein n=1 Tax=Teratosphaeria nubilosa TaxID=161662 RepID=A0A6G1LMC8_9PEZI|nr:DUF292-domain-containing protein [Teratosphaeria nubilosa]
MPATSSLVNKIKVQLKLSISRLRMVQTKDTALAKQARRSMAQLLEQGKEESARIRVENIIRSDMNTELLEVLELYCELLLARAGLLEAKECDPGLEEAVQSIMFAAPRVEGVKELGVVRQLLAEKYGKAFAVVAAEDKEGKVAERVRRRLRVQPPGEELVEAYLGAIAEAYGVDWPVGSKARREKEEADKNGEGGGDGGDDEPSGGGEKVEAVLEAPVSAEELKKATPPSDLGPKSPVSVVPPSPSTDNVRPRVVGADAGMKGVGKEEGPGGKIPDVDELAKRFAMLKR